MDTVEGELTQDFDGREVSYLFGELDTLVPAYAATIHKSQGSEYRKRENAPTFSPVMMRL